MWKNFDARFDNILQSLKANRDLVDQEAISIDIVEARSWRRQAEAAVREREKKAKIAQLQGAIDWLAIDDPQENDLDRLLQTICPDTADWISSNEKIKSWIFHDEGQSMMWLKGIPGGGKSTISSF